MTKTFAERCQLAQQFLPDAQYRAMLTALHAEMLAALAEQSDLQAEILEQCRINGMGADREDALRAEVERLKKAVVDEREACQTVCINLGNRWTQFGAWGSNTGFDQCADAIRARGNT